MNISSAVAGYVHSAVVQPRPGHSRPVQKDSDRDNQATDVQQQQSFLQTAAKGSVNLLV